MLSVNPLGSIKGLGNFQPDSATGHVDAAVKFSALVSTILGVITVAVGIFFIINFSTAGLQFVTAGADKGKLDQARDKMTMAIIGLIITIASYAIVGFIGAVFGLDILNPKATLGI